MENKLIFIILLIIIFVIVYSNKINETFVNEKKIYTIKNIEPQISYNIDAPIVFVYVYTPNILPYCQHSIKNLLSYAEKYNYGVQIYNQVFNNEVFPCWNKVASILTNLKKLTKCEYLVWIDADAIISNFSIPITSFVEKNPGYDMYLCEDIYVSKECINSGVMIIKNTPWSYNLFNKVWYSEIPHHHNDQNVIWLEIMKEKYPDVPNELKYPKYCSNLFNPKVKVLKENEFNSNIYNYKPGDFVLHLMGVKENCRINIMRQINTKLGLDSYFNTDCMDVLENINKSTDKTEMINTICLEKHIK